MPRLLSRFRSKHRGAALLMILIIMVVGAAFLLSALNSNPQIERDKVTADALVQAKEALIGYAATYRDNPTHATDVFGFLPLPDLGSTRNGTPEEGNAAVSFPGNTTNLTVIGKLPWRTLGLPALRDSKGECLWYAVSGSFQNVLKTSALNWDTLGHFDVFSSNGTPAGTVSATGNNFHQRPVAIIFSAGAALAGQDRLASANDTVATCGGNYDVHNYLDSFNADANINNIVNYFAGSINNATGYAYNLTGVADGSQLSAAALAVPKPIISGNIVTTLGNIVNDRALVITSDEIFSRIRRRNDFATDITTMLTNLAACLNAMPAASLPAASASNKGIDNIITACPAVGANNINVRNNWRENLLYARPGGTITVNGASCNAALLFGGERAAGQVRASSADKANAAMYLEGGNAASFPNGATYIGATAYTAANPAADVAICITGSGGGGGATQVSFANSSDFGSFTTAGTGVTMNTSTKTATITTASGSSGGCAWFPTPLTLNGKTLRAYYEFQFTNADPIGGVDLGYGFTLSFLQGDLGAPTTCGSQSKMGVVPASDRPYSLIVETDVRQDSGDGEPNGTPNHTAIMLNGNVDHSTTSGSLTAACNGTAYGCLHSPANKFEESPTPLAHNQRVEIHTGYNSTCTATGGSYALMKVWVDCTACSDTSANFSATPTAIRCHDLAPQMNTVYFGFTGGFSSAGGGQGVAIRNLDLRTE